MAKKNWVPYYCPDCLHLHSRDINDGLCLCWYGGCKKTQPCVDLDHEFSDTLKIDDSSYGWTEWKSLRTGIIYPMSPANLLKVLPFTYNGGEVAGNWAITKAGQCLTVRLVIKKKEKQNAGGIF